MTNPTPLPTRRQPVDLDIEHEIEHAIRQRPVTPQFEDLGRMSGEAVLAQFETAAKSVEEMGNLVKDAVKQLGTAMLQCDADMKFIIETAEAIRKKGEASQALVEKFSEMSRSIHDTCIEFKRRMDVTQ